MINKIKQTILDILADKRANGDVLPFATSIEVAHRVKLNIREVERITADIDRIVRGRTLNGEYYYE